MRKKLLMKSLLVAAGLCVGTSAWADAVVVPTPVYFNDFSFAESGKDDIEIVGNGVFEDDADSRFGRIFHNDPTLTKNTRTNYLKLPANVLSHSGTTKEMTIGFWVNMKDATDFYWSPLFTAYDKAERASNATESWPMFSCLARKEVGLNCWGYCDLGNTYNDKGTNAQTSAWLDDKEWHYYTITLTSTNIKVYIDGVEENSWTVDGTSDGQVISGVFNAGAAYMTNDYALKYICLGGNQSNNFDDVDPAFAYDDFAVYNKALTKDQISQIITNKLNRSVTGTQIGAKDNSTDYLAASSSQVTLKPGDSYHYRFINYNNGSTNWNNWILPVYDASDACVITVRADNWEDKHYSNTIKAWGNNAGCTSDFSWDNFPGELNGATIDMTITFTADKVFNMASTITTVDGSTWNYSYTNVYKYSVNEGTEEAPDWKKYDSPISLTSNDYIKVALSVSRSWIDLLEEGYSAIGVTTTAAGKGFATLYSGYGLNFAAVDGLTAYTATLAGSTVTLTEVGNIQAETGVVLKSATTDATTIYSVPVITTSTTDKGALTGSTTEARTFSDSDTNSYYMLAINGSGEAQFTKLTSGTIAAGKAYLVSASGARSLKVVFADETTGISGIQAVNAANGQTYNLSGQRVVAPQKGLYIVNGKKVIIK